MPSTQLAVPNTQALVVTGQAMPPDQHAAKVFIAGLGEGSRRAQVRALDTIAALLTAGQADAETLQWSALRFQHTAAVRAALQERYAPATVNRHLAALRGTLKAAWRLGQMDAETYQRAVDVPSVKGETLPRGRALGKGELRALFDHLADDGRPGAHRDAALLALLYGAGLRRSEAVALDVADYDPESGSLTLRQAKGAKDRLVYATNGAQEALEDWVAIRGATPGPLFCPVAKDGTVTVRRVTTQTVYNAVRKRARHAGVQEFSPHDLRRTMISDLLDSGADIASVKNLAGHADISTTVRYERRGEGAKRKAAELLVVPYRG